MRHYQTQGRPVMVRKTYFDCRKALKSHLGAAPSEVLEREYKAIA
jgi:DNA-binding SARP family transcriptional activator